MWAAGFFAVYYLVYGLAAVAADGFTVRHHAWFAWELAVPLWPWTAWIYVSLNLMVIPMLRAFPTAERIKPVIATLSAELLVAVAIFLVWPLEDGFSDPPATGALAWARTAALRHNYFPSLHVALAFTAAFTIGGPVLAVWATLIALSTLTTHQHHLVDVAGGILLAWAAVRVVYRRAVNSSE